MMTAPTNLRSAEAADFLGISIRTLDAWAQTGRGPAFFKTNSRHKTGGRRIYPLAELERFRDNHTVRPTVT